MALPLAREISRSDEKPPIRTAILPNDWGCCMVNGAFLLLSEFQAAFGAWFMCFQAAFGWFDDGVDEAA